MITKGTVLALIILGLVTGVSRVILHHDRADDAHASVVAAPTSLQDDPNVLFSAPGVTEPKSKTIQLFSEVSGVIREIHVRAGDSVTKGQLLVKLEDQMQKANVDLAEAMLQRTQAELDKIRSGDRPEEKAINRALYEEAESAVPSATFEWQRLQSLKQQDATSEKEVMDAHHMLEQAQAQRVAAKKRLELSEAGPRAEDISRADAAVKETRAQLEIARSVMEKTSLRSPIDGIVIYRFREPGEAVFSDVPAPILTVGDRTELHVRVDVDEIDIGNVRPDQQVWASAPAYPDRRFTGRVVHIEPTLGRKNFRTNRPTEKLDTRVLEVVVALEDADKLPIDLQMVIWFLRASDTPDSGTSIAGSQNKSVSPGPDSSMTASNRAAHRP
jgi:HlyD family secretion protein